MKRLEKKKRKSFGKAGFLFLLIWVLVFCGCAGTAGEAETKTAGKEEGSREDKIQIGLTVDSFVIERWIRDRDAFVATARELGAEVNVQEAGGSSDEQRSQIEYLIQKDMDVLVVVARDCNALSDVLQSAREKGIHVIAYDRLIYNSNCDMYISFDNREVGVLMAEALIEAIPSGGDIFMIQGSADDDNVPMVKDGFDDTIKGSNLNVVYTANCEGWLAEHAVQFVEEGLKKYPDVKGIMCGNDDIASQVVQVLAENRLAGKVIVVGQDCDVAACQRIVEGTQYMTAFKAIEDEARVAAEYAVRLGRGEKLSEITETVSDGTFDTLSKVLMPVSITRKNLDEIIIDGGFHQKEDVYLNVTHD